MQLPLNGKVALVTGATRGIGRAIAEKLSQAGASVALTYHSNPGLAGEVVSQLRTQGRKAIALPADITRPGVFARLFEEVKAEFGRIDVFVANAFATSVFAPTTAMTEADYDRMFAATKGHYFALQQAARHLSDGGKIVVISTGGTAMPVPAGGAYAGSKAAIEQFAFALAKEVAPRRISVNVVSPGATQTDGLVAPKEMIDALVAQTPMGRLGTPEDVAGAVYLLVTDEASWVTGQNLRATGGII